MRLVYSVLQFKEGIRKTIPSMIMIEEDYTMCEKSGIVEIYNRENRKEFLISNFAVELEDWR